MTKQDLPMWRIDNLIPMLLVIGSFFVYLIRLSIVETKMDTMILQQRELTIEFRDWKKQAETRIGFAESDVATLFSHHPQIQRIR